MVMQRPTLRTQTLVAVSFLILLAFGLRVINLDAFSFWTDEGLTPLRSGYPISEILSNRITIQEAITKDTHPPFYYLILHLTQQLWGQSDFSYRYPSLLAGVLLVPLLYQFGRRLQNRRVGLLAAMLVAINPLQIYYGNEARMYTVLVLLLAGASYVLWRALDGADLRLYLPLYVLLAGLALYTHYTAAFLIAGQGIFWIWILWRAGYKRLLIGAGILALLLAIPIIPFTVPRLFTGTEANYYYVRPSIMLHDVLKFFSLGVTFDFKHWSAPFLQLAVLALAVIGLWAAKPWRKRIFLLVYLLSVVLGLMAGSLLKPMYQAVRHIMASSPALLLLLAIGSDYLFGISITQERKKRWFLRSVAVVLLFAPIVGSILALNNLYNDSHYAKGDFRGLIAYIEAQAGERDLVLYHDAILLPMYEHYRTRSDLPATASPVYPYLADGVDERLSDITSMYDRIWFIPGAPSDGRDAEDKVPTWLDERLEVVDSKRISTSGGAVRVVGYRTSGSRADAVPENSYETDLSWAGTPVLRGFAPNFTQPVASETLWFDLFWQGGEAVPTQGMSLRLRLMDPDGVAWTDHEQPIARENDDWLETGIVLRSHKLSLPPGMPPGSYTLMAQAFIEAGSPLGEEHSLTELQIAAARDQSEVAKVVFNNGLMLQDLEISDDTVRPGHVLPFSILWQAMVGKMFDLNGLRYTLEVIGPDGNVLRTQGGQPGAEWLNSWPESALIREESGLYFHPQTEPGRYRLRWQLQDDDENVGGRPYWRPWTTETVDYGTVTVVPWPVNSELPKNLDIVEADFGPAIQLHSYKFNEPIDNSLSMELHWLAKDVPVQDYWIFVHVTNSQDGSIVSQVDRQPGEGLRPTLGWRKGEVMSDQISLPLPADLLPGEYEIMVGFYNPADGQRLPVVVAGEQQPNDQLALSTFVLP